jgi:hypothetical protein
LAFQGDELTLPAQTFSSSADLKAFILNHFERKFWLQQTSADFYLLAIQDCTNRAQFFGTAPGESLSVNAQGLSGGPADEPIGNRGAHAIVFAGYIDSVYRQDTRQEVYNRVAVHELGHATCGLTDVWLAPQRHKGGNSSNCVMNIMIGYTDGTVASGRNKFCDSCKTNILNHTW